MIPSYAQLQLEMSSVYVRQYENGQEVEIVQNDTKLVRTGYLNSSYKVFQNQNHLST